VALALKIKDVAGSTHDRLWVYVLVQIGKAVTVATSHTPACVRLRTLNRLMDEFEGAGFVFFVCFFFLLKSFPVSTSPCYLTIRR
jgi:hypothetical protein